LQTVPKADPTKTGKQRGIKGVGERGDRDPQPPVVVKLLSEKDKKQKGNYGTQEYQIGLQKSHNPKGPLNKPNESKASKEGHLTED